MISATQGEKAEATSEQLVATFGEHLVDPLGSKKL